MQQCSACEFVLFGPDGNPAACVNDGVVRVDWAEVEALAAYDGDPSSRASNIAKLLLAARATKNPPERAGENAPTCRCQAAVANSPAAVPVGKAAQ